MAICPKRIIYDLIYSAVFVLMLNTGYVFAQTAMDNNPTVPGLKLSVRVTSLDYWTDTEGLVILKLKLQLSFKNTGLSPIAIYRYGLYVGAEGIAASKKDLESNRLEAKGIQFSQLFSPSNPGEVRNKDFAVIKRGQTFGAKKSVELLLLEYRETTKDGRQKNHQLKRLSQGKHYLELYVMSWPWVGSESAELKRRFGGKWRLLTQAIEPDPIGFNN